MSLVAILLVIVGGAMGAVARFWIATAWAKRKPRFPAPTLFVNVTGSLLLGALFGALEPDVTKVIDAPVLVFAGVGFCGAYTTFSSFCTEWLGLLDEGIGKAMAYLGVTVVGCGVAFGAAFWTLQLF